MKNSLFITKNKRYNVLLVLLLSALTSCFKKDDKVVLPPPGNLQYGQLSLGEKYVNQVYFHFSNSDTTVNDHTKWDLAFEGTSSGYHIWMNGGNQALVANMGNPALFNSIVDTTGAYWRWDSPSWSTDSTAIGQWTTFIPAQPGSSNQVPKYPQNYRTESGESGVYLLDRGQAFTTSERFWKIIFQNVDESSYSFLYSKLDGSGLDSVTIYKNPAYNYIYFSFDNNGHTVTPEPPKNDWDILFTRYRYIFYHPFIPYLVEGVLINTYNTSVSVDSTANFASINYQFAKSLSYSTRRDFIGWNWKTYSVSAGQYTIRPNLNFIIKDQAGFYWKLKFLGYYKNGVEGYPNFEYQRL